MTSTVSGRASGSRVLAEAGWLEGFIRRSDSSVPEVIKICANTCAAGLPSRSGGLYCALAGRKQKSQKRRYALRPSLFIMLAPGNFFVVQVPALLPAPLREHLAQSARII